MTKKELNQAVLGLTVVGAVVVLFTLFFGGFGLITAGGAFAASLAGFGQD